MTLFIDTTQNAFVSSALFPVPISSVSFKRGDNARVNVVFVTDNVEVEATEGKLITFGIKESGKYDGDFLVTASDYTVSGTKYILEPSFSTVALNDLLNSGDDDGANDVASVTAMLEITYSDDGDNWLSTNTINAVIANDVVKGTEGTPLESPTPEEWLIGDTAPVNAVAESTASISLSMQLNPTAGDHLTVHGTTFEFVNFSIGTGNEEIFTDATLEDTNLHILAKINGHPTLTATAEIDDSSGVVIYADAPGTAGNSWQVSWATWVPNTFHTNTNVFASPANFAGGASLVVGTVAPPYLRTAGGFLYIQEAGIWKKAALSSL